MSLSESRKIELRALLDEFVRTTDITEYKFPPDLTNLERALVHKYCRRLGLHSKCRGNGDDRYLTICKQRRENVVGEYGVSEIPEIRVPNESLWNEVVEHVSRHPLTNAECQQLRERGLHRVSCSPTLAFSLTQCTPAIPPSPSIGLVPSDIIESKAKLPIMGSRIDFLTKIQSGQVVLILGETGSGKSTQIPQFILEQASDTSTRCRVVVAEPRRIAAVTLAERVACERGERIGGTVGYQIRLEARASPRTVLTFCTNGIVLKTILSDKAFFSSITHLIIDEVHERDKFTDYLLIIMRDVLPVYPHLKLILMSATLDHELFVRYFNTHQLLNVPGRTYRVDSFYLADILLMTGYTHALLKQRRAERPKELNAPVIMGTKVSPIVDLATSALFSGLSLPDPSIDSVLENLWKTGDDAAILRYIEERVLKGTVEINYQHSRSKASLLMIAAGLGILPIVKYLVKLGADRSLTSENGWKALHWAAAFGSDECVYVLNEPTSAETIVSVYHSVVDDDQIDVGLILDVLDFISEDLPEGGVLIFLPGYEDILQVKEAINRDSRFRSKFFLCMLHSQMPGSEQHKAFNVARDGTRKVVLSTNIAEVSITVEDIRYVIDTGKMKQRGYDAVNDVSAISTNWISKTNVTQRSGRAGRCQNGVCFHLYTELRYNSMPDAQIPEILRVPIYELCLQTKLLKPDLPSVAEFLEKAPDPPSTALVGSSIHLLKTISAFDLEERLTALGYCLSEIPVDPQLGKMILYGAMLRCLDPVVTIAAVLSYGDPFILPREREIAEKTFDRRYVLSKNTPFSDHAVLMNAYYHWENAKQQRNDRRFCYDHFLSPSSMELISSIKNLMVRALLALGFGANMSRDEFCRSFNQYSHHWQVVKAALTAGSYPNVALVDRSRGRLLTRTECSYMNRSSVLRRNADGTRMTREMRNRGLENVPTDWAIFHEMCRQNSVMQAKCATAIDSLTLMLFAGPCNLSQANVSSARIVNTENERWDTEDDGVVVQVVSVLDVDGWLQVRMENDVAARLLNFREKMHASFLRQLANPRAQLSWEDKDILQLAVKLLCQAS